MNPFVVSPGVAYSFAGGSLVEYQKSIDRAKSRAAQPKRKNTRKP